jgi:hypothetical protein
MLMAENHINSKMNILERTKLNKRPKIIIQKKR